MISLTRKFLLSKKKFFAGLWLQNKIQFTRVKMNSCITVWILTQSMCDKYRLPFVKHFHGEPLAQYYEVSILWVHSFKMLIGKAGRIGFRALTLVLSNRTTVLWLFNFLNMNVNTDRIRQCEVHFAVTKF